MDGQPQSQDAPARSDGCHPMDAFMHTAMESLKSMVDVNTILGVPVEAPDGSVIIPVSRVSFGFVAGGSEFETDPARPERKTFPFGGGSGAGVSLSPVAFLVVGRGEVRLLPVSDRVLYDRVLDLVPRVLETVQRWAGRDGQASQAEEPAPQAPAETRRAAAPATHSAPAGGAAGGTGSQPEPGAVWGGSPGGSGAQEGSGMHLRSGRRGGRSLTLRFE